VALHHNQFLARRSVEYAGGFVVAQNVRFGQG
jgi:hypothetical protein